MNYEYAVDNRNYEDFASGRVLYNQKGTTSYPARLISEIFMRCVAYMKSQGIEPPYSIYDPLCGGAYALTTLGFLHKDLIGRLIASDIDEEVVAFASKNLSLLSDEGLEERMKQLQTYYDLYKKESHQEAITSATYLQQQMRRTTHRIKVSCECADALRSHKQEDQDKYDMVITDVPYSELVDWATDEGENAVKLLLENMLPKLSKHSIVAISSKKKTKINNVNYKKIDKFNIGKRQIVFLIPIIA